MRSVLACCAVLLLGAPSSAQVGDTSCYQDVFGNWQCRGSKGDFELRKSSFQPDTWQMTPARGSSSPNCTIRRDLLGNIQSTCY